MSWWFCPHHPFILVFSLRFKNLHLKFSSESNPNSLPATINIIFFPGSVSIWFGWSNPRSLDGFFSCLMRYRSTKLQCDDKSCPLPLIKTKLFPFLHPCHFPSSRPITVFTLGTGTTVHILLAHKATQLPYSTHKALM